MFSAIQNFFSWFKDIFSNLWDFFQGFLDGMINLFKIIPKAVGFISSFITSLPGSIQIFATLTISICVIYLILGRETGEGG